MIEQTFLRRSGNWIHEPRDVDPRQRRAAELAAEWVCRDLGIAAPSVRWLPSDRTDVRGETLPVNLTEVWIRAGQSVAATVETTAHEIRHAWQLTDYRWVRPGLETFDEREADARAYGLAIRAQLTGG